MAGENSNAVLADTQERWLPIVGWLGFYEISDYGRVRSVDRTVSRFCNGFVCDVHLHGRIMALSPISGYRGVALSRNGTTKASLVHRLLVEAFVEQIPPGKEVNHKDGVKSNNHLKNLEVVTHRENSEHASQTGLMDHIGEGNPRSILTAEDVREIRTLRATKGITYLGLAKMFGVTGGCICGILRRQTWKHIA